MAAASYYPPSPPDVPIDLTEPTPAYRQQVVLVLLSVGIFLLLYFGLLFLSALLLYKLIVWPGPTVLRVILFVPCALLFLFLFKNVVKFEKAGKSYDVEVFEDEHPRLFEFILRLCDETGAPMPHRVYVCHDVNAYVCYTKSLFHLVWPAKKNLNIGLGLVNAINLTEFKATLAHEFGHISQKSMKATGYAYAALRIIDNLVYGHDTFDYLLDGWRSAHPAISWPAWGVWGILWLLRKLLAGMFMGILFLERALSRQMEFNADLMAVSATGSDAPVHLLQKSWFATACLQQTIEDLSAARDHDLLTSDLFHHLDRAGAYLRRKAKNPRLGMPPALPADPRQQIQVFKPDEDEDEQAAMWETHPSNYDREVNAKYDYVRSTFDERSPWLLFDDVQKLRERVTVKFYRYEFKARRELLITDAEHVQKFIDEERAETTYDPKYQGLYDQRNLFLDDVHERAQLAAHWKKDLATLAQFHAAMYHVEVKHRAQLYNYRHQEYNRLTAIANRWERPKNGEFEFRGEWRRVRDAKHLLKKLDQEYERDEAWFKELDEKVFDTFYQMALQLNHLWATELFRRYEFHLDLQKIWKRLHQREGAVNAAIEFLRDAPAELHPDDFHDIIGAFCDAYDELRDALRFSEGLIFPPLANMPAGEPVRPFLLSKKLVSSLGRGRRSLRTKWIDRFLKQFGEVQGRINRLHFKSMGGILVLQETIGAEALRRCPSQLAAIPRGPLQ